VTDALAERTYDADLAGMSYHFDAKIHGLTVSVAGYSDKMSVLLESILKEMTTFVVNPERFTVQKEQVRASLLFMEGLRPF
jgi:insulysin